MPIRHAVLFRFTDDATEAQIEALAAGLTTMPEQTGAVDARALPARACPRPQRGFVGLRGGGRVRRRPRLRGVPRPPGAPVADPSSWSSRSPRSERRCSSSSRNRTHGGGVTRSVQAMSIAIELTRALPTATRRRRSPRSRRRRRRRVRRPARGGGRARRARCAGSSTGPGIHGASRAQSCVVPAADGRVVVALGLGRPSARPPSPPTAGPPPRWPGPPRRQAHLAIDVLDGVPERLDRPAVAQAVAEGVVLGAYRYTALKSDPEPNHIESLTGRRQGRQAGAGRPRAGPGRRPRPCASPATSSTSRAAR